MFVGLIILLVLIGLCVALGAIYSYIYFTRINPRARHRAARRVVGSAGGPGGGGGGLRKFVEPSTGDDDTAGNATAPSTSTHVFLFRKS